jgi:hypothetical protein
MVTMARRKSLRQSEPGSLDELIALHAIAVSKLAEAQPREASPLIAKTLELGRQIREARDAEAKKLEELVYAADEPFDPASV